MPFPQAKARTIYQEALLSWVAILTRQNKNLSEMSQIGFQDHENDQEF